MRLLTATAGLLLAVVGAPAQTQSAVSWSGTLLDAGCTDRSLQNLRAQPTQTLATSKPAQKSPDGITVTPQVTKSERGDTVWAHTPDHASRYSSASCAVTADTKSFMLLLPDGTLLNLDEGGNTLALEAFQDSPAGHTILNGKVGGLKPQATILGVRSGDRLQTRSIELRQTQSPTPGPAK
jgi:hypothetical protein